MTQTQHFDPATTVVGGQVPLALAGVSPSEVSVGVFDDAGNSEFGVEFTLDDANDPNVTSRWFELSGMPAGSTGTQHASFTFPVRFVRLNLTFLTGAVEFKVLQTVERC